MSSREAELRTTAKFGAAHGIIGQDYAPSQNDWLAAAVHSRG